MLLIFILFLGYRGLIANYAAGGWLTQLPILGALVVSTLKLPFLAGNATLDSLLHAFTPSPQFVATNMLMPPHPVRGAAGERTAAVRRLALWSCHERDQRQYPGRHRL